MNTLKGLIIVLLGAYAVVMLTLIAFFPRSKESERPIILSGTVRPINYSATSTNVAVGAAGIQALPANSRRNGVDICYSTGTAPLYIQPGTASSVAPSGLTLNTVGECKSFRDNNLFVTPFFLITQAGNATATILEW